MRANTPKQQPKIPVVDYNGMVFETVVNHSIFIEEVIPRPRIEKTVITTDNLSPPMTGMRLFPVKLRKFNSYLEPEEAIKRIESLGEEPIDPWMLGCFKKQHPGVNATVVALKNPIRKIIRRSGETETLYVYVRRGNLESFDVSRTGFNALCYYGTVPRQIA